ncbi:hypothetical protein DC74_6333 [Streptomyces noursei]|uniref:Uncharacterized protein n=1 Tax=Streptomyces noursei TaxID=1971 RepID=A0A059WAH9_STRNR|nr:hypothetical protein DC74_6333 [Streptomyces noursei]GCB94265.1 hypothetical protein SALB_07063 [Streptomyces noursei]
MRYTLDRPRAVRCMQSVVPVATVEVAHHRAAVRSVERRRTPARPPFSLSCL